MTMRVTIGGLMPILKREGINTDGLKIVRCAERRVDPLPFTFRQHVRMFPVSESMRWARRERKRLDKTESEPRA